MSEPHKYAAKVSDKGELQIAEPIRWRAALSRLKGQVIYVVLERLKHNRSLQANRRYWGLLVPLAGEVLSAGRPLPFSKDQVHYALKMAFLGHEDTPLGPIPKRSSKLDIEQFNGFMRKIEHWLLHDHGIVVPAVGERLEEHVA